MLEMEIFRLKSKLGELMNVALEIGESEVLDRFEAIMSNKQTPELRISMNDHSFAG